MTSPDSSPEAAFFRQLQHVTTRIHDTDNLEQIMLDTSPAICQLLGADRFTLYVVNDEHTAIVSRVKTGLNTAKELKLPIGTQSIAGFVAQTQRTLNIADVYDDAELQRIDPQLTFLQQVDHRSGYRTRQMLVAPIVRAGLLQGVFQVVNRTSGGAFGALEREGVQQLCETLSSAIRQRVGHTLRTSMLSSRYHGLVADGVVTADELTRCMQAARAQSIPAEKALVAELGVTPAQLGASMARFFQTSYVPFDAKRLRSDSLQGKLKREFVLAHHWIPLEDTPTGLLVMTLDPEDVRNSRIVPQVFPQFAKCVYAVTTVAEFEQTVEQFWGAHTKEDSVEDLLADLAPADTETDSNESALASAAQDNDLVKFVNKVIIDGYRQGASDIHFEPQPGKAKAGIRFRIDGSLQPYAEIPASYRDAIVARLKIMCDLDISEKRKPQDGKIKFKKYGPLDIELRVATLPSAGGVEDVVMRILAAGEPIALDKLGLTPHNRERLVATISKPYGLFYVCGPTGSGKTTTLHSILKHLNTPETKIWTAEDPVEITQKGLRQVQVNKKAGIDFALVMRAFLRADPDIIMVGESRDKETVSMGVEASLTGHLVFSTLHTNSAPESITRLLDMGMDPFNFADALLGILAQRLAKRLCVCKETYVPTPDELQAFATEYALEYAHTPASQVNPAEAAQRLVADWMQQHGQDGTLKLYRATGCETCRGTGYKGRVGLHELLIADNATRKLIQERARVADLSTACITAGMHTLKMDGMEKVLLGLTDLKQVRAVCMK